MSNSKAFASQADLEVKQVSFDKLSDNAYAYTAEGDPNTGIIIGDDSVMIIDATATPVMAQDVIAKVREITDKPIKYVVHQVRRAHPLPCRQGARRVGLQVRRPRAGHRQPRHLRTHRRARPAGHGFRDRPFPAIVQRGRERARSEMADHDVQG